MSIAVIVILLKLGNNGNLQSDRKTTNDKNSFRY